MRRYYEYPLTLYIVRLQRTGGARSVNVTTKALRRIEGSPLARGYKALVQTRWGQEETTLLAHEVERGERPDLFGRDVVGLGLTLDDAFRHAIKFQSNRVDHNAQVHVALMHEKQLLVAAAEAKSSTRSGV